MFGTIRNTDILASLEKNQLLADFNLSLYGKPGANPDRINTALLQYSCIVRNEFSSKTVLPYLQRQINNTLESGKSIICRLHGGLLCFLVPFSIAGESMCLVGDGVRERSINILKLEELCRTSKADVFQILGEIEKLPVKTYGDVKEVVTNIQDLLVVVREEADSAGLMDNVRAQLDQITSSLARIDELVSPEEVLAYSGEILKTLFNIPTIAIALRDEMRNGFLVKGICGLPAELGILAPEKLSRLIPPGTNKMSFPGNNEISDFLCLPASGNMTFFPFEFQGFVFGFAVLQASGLNQLEEVMVELLAGRITAKLGQLKKAREQMLAGTLSGNLMSLTSTLLFAESKEDLYRTILEIAADLVGASRGSIMLIDKNGKSLNIGFCKGMNSYLARSINVRLGEGIAGKVASSGQPLLVGDVENDSRVRMPNRPRFKTKSLLCVPLKLKDRVIGVLNLSDKEKLDVFNESDLILLESYANLASLMIERKWALERSTMLEKLSVTDHLTGLYNHRFLRNRLEEELNRSTRSGLYLSLVFLDLDFFKVYNDLCGHLAGDEALRKTADILKAAVRDMDIVVRYGGEEFCIVLPDTSKPEGVQVAERIRKEIEYEKFPNEENMPRGCLTASFGVATFPEDGHTYTTLVHSADLALYRAKAEGRNRVVSGRPVLPRDAGLKKVSQLPE